MAKRKVRESGNSLVVGLTESALVNLNLKLGDYVDMKVKGQTITITKKEKRETDVQQP